LPRRYPTGSGQAPSTEKSGRFMGSRLLSFAPSLGFSQVLTLKVVKVLCFDTLSHVFILNGLVVWCFASLDLHLKSLRVAIDAVRRSLEGVRRVRMAESMEAHHAQSKHQVASHAGCGEPAGAPIHD